MTLRRLVSSLAGGAALAVALSALVHAQAPQAAVAEAAAKKDIAAVRKLLKEGADVNGSQGDGMTALHWAAMNGDGEMASLLLYAGANPSAETRLGGFTPLHLAAEGGFVSVIRPLITAGAKVNEPTSTGATPLMQAAASGNTEAVTVLVENGADSNLKEKANGQTALMFAAARDRADVVKTLIAKGADVTTTSAIVNLAALSDPEQEQLQQATGRQAQPEKGAKVVPGLSRPFNYNELIGKQGGLTALHFAIRQGATATVKTLVESGADVNQVSPGDRTSPLLMAAINGYFDIASYLLDKGADPNLVSENGVAPLYAVINVQWQPRSFYPQPRAYLQQQMSYMDLVTKLLDKGADPNARVNRKTWFMQYNFDLLRIDDAGATPFWRAAYASDIDAMKLLVSRGADPNVPTMKAAFQERFQAGTRGGSEDADTLPKIPVGGPGIPALLAAAGVGYGEGFAGNAHRFAPTGMMAAVKYLVEELHADVNAVDDDGNTAVHHAASRGDNEMILYLVSKGADVKRVNRRGQTTVDMANGPVQRTQPFPETIKLLESLGAKNNHKCVSC
jgi:ankyrin repeat protein